MKQKMGIFLHSDIQKLKLSMCRKMPVTNGFTPDKIIVARGTNRYDDSSYDYEHNVSEFYKRLISVFPNTPVSAITSIW